MTALFRDKYCTLEVRVHDLPDGKTVCISCEDNEDSIRGASIIITADEAKDLIDFLQKKLG